MIREDLEAAWLLICSTAKDGDFVVSRKKGEWKIQVASLMDATLAHRVVSYMAERETEEGDEWHPDMFDEK